MVAEMSFGPNTVYSQRHLRHWRHAFVLKDPLQPLFEPAPDEAVARPDESRFREAATLFDMTPTGIRTVGFDGAQDDVSDLDPRCPKGATWA